MGAERTASECLVPLYGLSRKNITVAKGVKMPAGHSRMLLGRKSMVGLSNHRLVRESGALLPDTRPKDNNDASVFSPSLVYVSNIPEWLLKGLS